jgi:leader peptidase (prepilin peptidase)/N-methyltransferase
MTVFLSSLFFLLGASFASFGGLAVHRLRALPPGRSAWAELTGRSRCDGCGARLSGVELIPVAGWLMAGGRCRRCGCHVPAIYPVTEAAAGGVPVAMFLYAGPEAAAGALVLLVLFIGLGVVFLAMRGRG